MADVAAQMADAERVRIPDREHINAFLDVDVVLPLVLSFLGAHHSVSSRPLPSSGEA